MPPLTAANQELRAQNVSASEVGALMDEGHPYTTAAAIYDRLKGGDGKAESESMSIGSWFEQPILRLAEQRDGFKARANSRTFVHRQVRLCATPDAVITRPHPGLMVPERGLVEIKMTGRPDLWRELPPHVEWQARAQLACTGRDVVYIYALVGMSLRVFSIYRDRGKEAELLERVQRFWTDHIVTGERPAPAVAPVGPFSFDAA